MENFKVFVYARTALQNLFRKPATTAYPYQPAQFPERMRGHVEIDTQECISCGLCMRSCPPGAIRVDRASGTWTINRFDCVQCGSCVNQCPKKCLKLVPGYTRPGAEKKEETFKLPEKKTVKPAENTAVKAAGKMAGGKAEEGEAAGKAAEGTVGGKAAVGAAAGKAVEGTVGGKAAVGAAAGNPAAGLDCMKPQADLEKCVYCTLCAKKCPQEAIVVDREKKAWTLDEEKCVGCGLCEMSCPKKAIEMN